MRSVTIGGRTFEVDSVPSDYWDWVSEGRFNHEWSLYDKHLNPEHTFVDLGAWVGSHSLYAALVARRVVSVEPDPVAYQILIHNLSYLSPRPETHVVKKAITNQEEGTVTIGSGLLGASTTRLNPNAGGGIGPWKEGQECVVGCTTLRKLCAEYPNPLFIKIDVEGAEELIFEDVSFFKERKPTVYVEFHPFWWKDEATVRKNFQLIVDNYKRVTCPRSNSFVLEP